MVSTFGTLVIADVADEAAAQRLSDQFREVLGRRFVALQEAISPTIRNPLDDTEADVEVGDTSVRVTLLVDGAVAAHTAGEVFGGVGAGRAVMCEDGDEWGVTVSAWQLTADEARCVYRAYIPAEDGSVDTDAVARTITGTEPATEVARLFDVDPDPLVALDADPSPIREEIGFYASPFLPWLHALDLDWPEP